MGSQTPAPDIPYVTPDDHPRDYPAASQALAEKLAQYVGQCGVDNVTWTTTGPGATATVTFDEPFPAGSTPVVQLTKQSGGAAKTIPYATGISTTGFTMGLYTGDASNVTAGTWVPVAWTARLRDQ